MIKTPPQPEQRSSKPAQKLKSKQQSSSVHQDQRQTVVDDINQINILRQEMLKEATSFSNQLDELQSQLVRKSNELEILTSKQMDEISQKNIALVQEFINYQEHFIKKLQGKCSNWDIFQLELAKVQYKLDQIMNRNELVPKLAQIQVMQSEIQKLVEEVEDLKKKKDQRRR